MKKIIKILAAAWAFLRAIFDTLFPSAWYNSTHIIVYNMSDGSRKTQKCPARFVPSIWDINRVEGETRCAERPLGYVVVGYFLLRAEK